ncbi:hypothetical protein FRB93_010031 [Tulasnella sp. JGI-2019a]|nr:hypothetical protein FRB93_010031 [Tulasnella sp. JGI-2019a]
MVPVRSEISNKKHKKQIPRRLRYQEPPSVDHLPWVQAQKVKREWVEEKMIKRAYFHEKKKMGLVPAKTGANVGAEDSGWGNKRWKVERHKDEASTSRKQGETATEPVGGSILGADRLPVKDAFPAVKRPRPCKEHGLAYLPDSATVAGPSISKAEVPPELTDVTPPGLHRLQSSPLAEHIRNNKRSRISELPNARSRSDQFPSLRDLTRKAYSRSSLHTYKSEPLSSRKPRGGGDRTGRTGASSQVKTTNAKGQPNMKLRIDAMLKRIQRTTK